jgi:hypothetical protein
MSTNALFNPSIPAPVWQHYHLPQIRTKKGLVLDGPPRDDVGTGVHAELHIPFRTAGWPPKGNET